MEGLTDDMLFSEVLEPGARSAVMSQNSPQNLNYKDKDPDLEIAFFYVNVSSRASAPVIVAKADVP